MFVVPVELGPDTVRALTERARQEKVTIYSVLAAGLAMATAEWLGMDPVRLLIGGAVSLRDRLEPPVGLDCMYCASGVASIPMVGRDTKFWPLAGRIRGDLMRSIDCDEPFVLLPKRFSGYARLGALLCRGHAGPRRFARMIEVLQPASLTVSNVGRIDAPSACGPLRIKSLGFGAALSALGCLGSTAATINDVLTWHIGGMEPCLSRETIRRIANRAREIIVESTQLSSSSGEQL
jgi:hypothetical protein